MLHIVVRCIILRGSELGSGDGRDVSAVVLLVMGLVDVSLVVLVKRVVDVV